MARPDTQRKLAIEMIRKRIAHGDHAAFKLPGERGLAGELGLSRQTVRKAIDHLIEEGALHRGETGRLSIVSDAVGLGKGSATLVAFLHPGEMSSEIRMWRDGILEAFGGENVVLRSLGYAHYGDAAISAALDGFHGVFIMPQAEANLPGWLAIRMNDAKAKVVVVDQDESLQGLRSVIVFPHSSVRKLMDHLIRQGHRCVHCVNVQPRNPVIEARIAAWSDLVGKNGYSGELICGKENGRIEAAYDAVQQWLSRGAERGTALYCTTLSAALGATRALYDRGISTGSDMGVCVVNDEGLGPFLVPSLTSLQTPSRARYLKRAVEWMLSGEGWDEPSLHQPREAPLFIGESTVGIPVRA